MIELDKDTAEIIKTLKANSYFQRYVASLKSRLSALDASSRNLADNDSSKWSQGRRQELADQIASIETAEQTFLTRVAEEAHRARKGRTT